MATGDSDELDLTRKQLTFLEDYEQGTQAPPPAATTQDAGAARQRRPRRQGAPRAGLYWVLAQSCLAVAEHALRTVDALGWPQWQPPHWLCPAVASQTTTMMQLMTRLNGAAHHFLKESGHHGPQD